MLYDVVSSYFEGRTAHWQQSGTLTTSKKGKLQIIFDLRVGNLLGRFRMAKHFEITESTFTCARRTETIAAEARLDGIYVLRTSFSKKLLGPEDTVRMYQDLAKMEGAFRCLETVDLHVWPIHHRLEPRVRAHVFLCLLTYHGEWHMRRTWAQLLFAEHDPQDAAQGRNPPVQPAIRSASAQAKASTRKTPEGETVHRFRGLLDPLATLTKNTIAHTGELPPLDRLTVPTTLQRKAFGLLESPIPLWSVPAHRPQADPQPRRVITSEWAQNFGLARRGPGRSRTPCRQAGHAPR